MSIQVSVSQQLQIVEDGVTVIDLSDSQVDYQVDFSITVPLRLAPAASLVFEAGVTSLIAAWTAIAGLAGHIDIPGYGELTFNSLGTEPVQIGPGPFNLSRAEAGYVALTNTSAVLLTGSLTLFGRIS
jgi:hypothetical protein